MTADVFAITLGGARDLEGSDAEKKRRIVGAFASSYGVEQTRRRARLLPGVADQYAGGSHLQARQGSACHGGGAARSER